MKRNTEFYIKWTSILSGWYITTVESAIKAFTYGTLEYKDKKITIQDYKAYYLCAKACFEDYFFRTEKYTFTKVWLVWRLMINPFLPVNKKKKVTSTIQSNNGQSIEILIGYTI